MLNQHLAHSPRMKYLSLLVDQIVSRSSIILYYPLYCITCNYYYSRIVINIIQSHPMKSEHYGTTLKPLAMVMNKLIENNSKQQCYSRIRHCWIECSVCLTRMTIMSFVLMSTLIVYQLFPTKLQQRIKRNVSSLFLLFHCFIQMNI